MRVLRILLAVSLLGALAACGSSSPGAVGADKVVNVVAAENFYGDIAAQLGGDRVHVTSIINDPESDPHLYESDARDAAGLADARVVIENGLGYDDFVDKLLGATKGGRTVLKVADVLSVTGDNANPHLWYDVPRIPDVARAIVDAFTAADPGGADVVPAQPRRVQRLPATAHGRDRRDQGEVSRRGRRVHRACAGVPARCRRPRRADAAGLRRRDRRGQRAERGRHRDDERRS